jgi:signal peptidase II
LKKSLLIIFIVLFLDQLLKIWVKTHMSLGDEVHLLGERGMLHFTENIGMAFGMRLAGDYGKLILSLFRIIASVFLFWYINQLVKKQVNFGVILSFSLITAGAIGNIIDSAFYGLIFSESTPFSVAALFPEGGGYASFLHGKVVDMLYFPLIQGQYPQWFPFWKGQEFIFFRPVFNLADSSITIGVLSLILFQTKFLNTAFTEKKQESTPLSEIEDSEPTDNQP